MQLRPIRRLDECYRIEPGTFFMTGLQALVRLLLTQRWRDARDGLDTAGFVSGYRGSPLGGLDRELWRAAPFLEPAGVRFLPGLNEELAATSVWGSQQVGLFPGASHDGVFGLWYGKGPGVDRSGDAFKHGNAAGTSRHGGVLVAAGDDHTCKSSTLPQQSEYSFIDAMMPVLNPADVGELLELGLLGFGLSRYSGCWVGFKIVQETADATHTVDCDPEGLRIVEPQFDMPPGGLNIRWPDPPLEQEARLHGPKLEAALAFARANALNRIVIDAPAAQLGIVASGKAYRDVRQALADLGIDRGRAAALGIRLLKLGMSWPLEPQITGRFSAGLEEVLVVEEKRGVIESQLKEQLCNRRGGQWPLIVGKRDEHGQWLLPSSGALTPEKISQVIAKRLRRFDASGDVQRRLRQLLQRHAASGGQAAISASAGRLPHFCSGCPHNTSTRVPEDSRAIAGIGCHFMAAWMDRSTVTYTQMGGEGATWIGQEPFTETGHVFQNIGDGTYAHSGTLAVRAAVAAGSNITFKILYNGAVAMTGGQQVEGELTVARIAAQLLAEGVAPVIVVSNDPGKYVGREKLPARVEAFDRRALDRLQRRLREQPGVSALIYDQRCAAELRRERKRQPKLQPARRAVINELVCEGCGDCNLQSNCLSVVAVETELGRKRTIDQSSCNVDFSCLEGFCPSFVTVQGSGPTRRPPSVRATPPALAEPPAAACKPVYNIVIAGVGGTGVVTTSGLLGLAAHLEGKAVRELDQTGLAQKFGAVLSHLRIAAEPDQLHVSRIPAAQADLLLGVDLMVAAGSEPIALLSAERSRVLVNSHEELPPRFIQDPDLAFPGEALLSALRTASRNDGFFAVDATRLAADLLGDGIAANIFMLGCAFQHGLLPVGGAALYRALELYGVSVEQNKLAFDWGRCAAEQPARITALTRLPDAADGLSASLDEAIEYRAAHLRHYQDARYAGRYRERVQRFRALERSLCPSSEMLTQAVARAYFRLLAVKDEYEVARLYVDTGFVDRLRNDFGAGARLRFHLSPPLLARRDPVTGRPRKYELGGWVLGVLRLLARLRFLRGTAFDLFSYTAERRFERRLLADYESLLDRLLVETDARRLELAAELAALPERIRGFGPVKKAAAARAKEAERILLARWEGMADRSPQSSDAAASAA